jgi:hypothetical protein
MPPGHFKKAIGQEATESQSYARATVTKKLNGLLAIYGKGFVKPGCWCKSMRRKSARPSPSPSASVDLPHLSRRPAGVCAFCRISLEPEAEGDRPPASVASSSGRRERDALNHLFGIVRWARTSPGKRYAKDAATHFADDPRWGGRRGQDRGHPSKSSRPPAHRLDKTLVHHSFVTTPLTPTRPGHVARAGTARVLPGRGPPPSRR